MREGMSLEEINKITFYDPWFLEQIQSIVLVEEQVKKEGLPKDYDAFLNLKRMGKWLFNR